MRTARANEQTDRPIAIATWIDDEGEPIETPEPIEPSQALSELSQWIAHQVEASGEIQATAGPRLGPPPERTRRTGAGEEVVSPMLLKPEFVVSAVRRGAVFDRPLQRMQIHVDSLDTSGLSCTWFATLTTGMFSERAATLRLGPSPSGNLTVLQLVPQRARRFRTRAFVDAGIPAVDEVCDRLREIVSTFRET